MTITRLSSRLQVKLTLNVWFCAAYDGDQHCGPVAGVHNRRHSANRRSWRQWVIKHMAEGRPRRAGEWRRTRDHVLRGGASPLAIVLRSPPSPGPTQFSLA